MFPASVSTVLSSFPNSVAASLNKLPRSLSSRPYRRYAGLYTVDSDQLLLVAKAISGNWAIIVLILLFALSAVNWWLIPHLWTCSVNLWLENCTPLSEIIFLESFFYHGTYLSSNILSLLCAWFSRCLGVLLLVRCDCPWAHALALFWVCIVFTAVRLRRLPMMVWRSLGLPLGPSPLPVVSLWFSLSISSIISSERASATTFYFGCKVALLVPTLLSVSTDFLWN